MLDIINNALRNNKYYICLYNDNVYIYNYLEILSFTDNLIYIKLNDCNLKIKGNNLKMIKMEKNELLFKGEIIGVSYE